MQASLSTRGRRDQNLRQFPVSPSRDRNRGERLTGPFYAQAFRRALDFGSTGGAPSARLCALLRTVTLASPLSRAAPLLGRSRRSLDSHRSRALGACLGVLGEDLGAFPPALGEDLLRVGFFGCSSSLFGPLAGFRGGGNSA